MRPLPPSSRPAPRRLRGGCVAWVPGTFVAASLAQDAARSGPLHDELAAMDARLFEAAFVTCDAEALRAVLTEDAEFHQDKTGASFGDAVKTMKSCPRDNGVTLTQVPGSLEVYPKRGYRAVQIGRHVFARAGEPAAGSCGGQGFGDFFTSMFGRAAQPESPDARVERGRDEYFGLVIDASDAVDRAVNLRSLVPDAQGHRVVVMRQLQVQIPKGICAGQHLRLPGQGSAGDLYRDIQFKGAARGQSCDLLQPLAPWEAALGGDVTATTPAGELSVTVPPDTPHGKRLRLKGRGLAGPSSEQPGDLVCRST